MLKHIITIISVIALMFAYANNSFAVIAVRDVSESTTEEASVDVNQEEGDSAASATMEPSVPTREEDDSSTNPDEENVISSPSEENTEVASTTKDVSASCEDNLATSSDKEDEAIFSFLEKALDTKEDIFCLKNSSDTFLSVLDKLVSDDAPSTQFNNSKKFDITIDISLAMKEESNSTDANQIATLPSSNDNMCIRITGDTHSTYELIKTDEDKKSGVNWKHLIAAVVGTLLGVWITVSIIRKQA